jgi:hypothetical protein
MLELQQWFEALEITSNELGSLIIIHTINNTITNFERENGKSITRGGNNILIINYKKFDRNKVPIKI